VHERRRADRHGGESSDDIESNDLPLDYLNAFLAGRSDLNGRLTSLILTHPNPDHTRHASCA
jgi:hypothetical protein